MPLAVRRTSLTLEDGAFRQFRFEGVELVAAIYPTVRDQRWRTPRSSIAANLLGTSNDMVSASLVTEHHGRHLAVRCTTEVKLWERRLEVELVADVLEPSVVNRIGLCLIHPSRQRGARLAASTVNGLVESWLQEEISPHVLATDIESLDLEADLGVLQFRFQGEMFEVEDHRNWSDPGWKTYSPPLSRPHPLTRLPGEQIRQSVAIEWHPKDAGRNRPGVARNEWPTRRRANRPIVIDPPSESGERMPRLGTSVRGDPLAYPASLRPDYLQVELWGDSDWEKELDLWCDYGTANAMPLFVTVVAATDRALSRICAAVAQTDCFAVSVVHATTLHTVPGMVRTARRAMQARPGTAIGGGSLLHFAEVNRMVAPPDEWDLVAIASNPQVHHDRDADILATPSAVVNVCRDAMRFADAVFFGPITLRPRSSPKDPSRAKDLADSREGSMFEACWLASTIAAAAPFIAGFTWIPQIEGASSWGQRPVDRLFDRFTSWVGLPLIAGQTSGRNLNVFGVRGRTEGTEIVVCNTSSVPQDICYAGATFQLSGYELVFVTTTPDGETTFRPL